MTNEKDRAKASLEKKKHSTRASSSKRMIRANSTSINLARAQIIFLSPTTTMVTSSTIQERSFTSRSPNEKKEMKTSPREPAVAVMEDLNQSEIN